MTQSFPSRRNRDRIPPTGTQNSALERQQLEITFRKIQLEWDILKEKEKKLDQEEFTIDEINLYRKIILSKTLERYKQILFNLSWIESTDLKIIEEWENLTTICNHKIRMLEETSAYYHANQISESDRVMAIDEYRSAKYAFQQAIGLITPFPETNKFYNFAKKDRIELETSIYEIDWELGDLYY